MASQSLFDHAATLPGADVFAGADYDPARDHERLSTQLECILWLAKDGNWRTITRLAAELRRQFPEINFPENSVQAQMRNLRKLGFEVERRRIGNGLSEYRIGRPTEPTIAQKIKALLGRAK